MRGKKRNLKPSQATFRAAGARAQQEAETCGAQATESADPRRAEAHFPTDLAHLMFPADRVLMGLKVSKPIRKLLQATDPRVTISLRSRLRLFQDAGTITYREFAMRGSNGQVDPEAVDRWRQTVETDIAKWGDKWSLNLRLIIGGWIGQRFWVNRLEEGLSVLFDILAASNHKVRKLEMLGFQLSNNVWKKVAGLCCDLEMLRLQGWSCDTHLLIGGRLLDLHLRFRDPLLKRMLQSECLEVLELTRFTNMQEEDAISLTNCLTRCTRLNILTLSVQWDSREATDNQTFKFRTACFPKLRKLTLGNSMKENLELLDCGCFPSTLDSISLQPLARHARTHGEWIARLASLIHSRFPSLTNLDLSGTLERDPDLDGTLFRPLSILSSLKTFIMNDVALSESDSHHVGHMISQYTKLAHLSLGRCRDISGGPIIKGLSGLSSLTYLSLWGIKLEDHGQEISKLLQQNTGLTALDLGKCPLKGISHGLSRYTALTKLHVEIDLSVPDNIDKLANILRQNLSLQVVTIRHSKLTTRNPPGLNKGMSKVVDALCKLPAIQELTAHATGLSGKMVENLVGHSLEVKTLKCLGLSLNHVNDSDLTRIANILPSCTHLDNLDIAPCSQHQKGLRKMQEACKKVPVRFVCEGFEDPLPNEEYSHRMWGR